MKPLTAEEIVHLRDMARDFEEPTSTYDENKSGALLVRLLDEVEEWRAPTPPSQELQYALRDATDKTVQEAQRFADEHSRAMALLKRLEFVFGVGCPICKAWTAPTYPRPHRPDCELAALIKACT